MPFFARKKPTEAAIILVYSMRILFLVPYPAGKAPSQRFRYEQYLDYLTKAGHTYTVRSFMSDATWDILYKPGHQLPKMLGTIGGFLRRLICLPEALAYDWVFIHREAAPIGPPVIEWLLTKVLRRKVVYDFDDAIWMALTSKHNQLAALVKWHGKVASICRWSYRVSCGNDFLCDYARQYNSRVVLNPTTIDTVHLHNRTKDQRPNGPVVLGWTGTHSNMVYLASLLPVLRRLEDEGQQFIFRVISNQNPHLDLRSFDYVPWRKATEMDDLITFNVGVMPLEEQVSILALGKCGFKSLQYMALGIPALASPVGVNTKIIVDGQDGFLCETPEQWYQALRQLLTDAALRTHLGAHAQQTVRQRYSVLSNADNFLALFDLASAPASVVRPRPALAH